MTSKIEPEKTRMVEALLGREIDPGQFMTEMGDVFDQCADHCADVGEPNEFLCYQQARELTERFADEIKRCFLPLSLRIKASPRIRLEGVQPR
jgi:hypothetical protein